MGARRRKTMIVAGTMLAALTVAPAAGAQTASPRGAPLAASADTLRGVAPDHLYVGSAVAGGGHHMDQDYPDPFSTDEIYRDHLAAEFSSLTPENQLKWDFVHPEPDTYEFGPADDIVAFAEEHGQVVRGHALLWHSQNPAWLEDGDHSAAELREILRDHIFEVVGRYAGRIHQWDVANEIFDDEGDLRLEDNIWLRELGPEIVADAFRWANEADPEAELFLNDYNVESINAKSTAYLEFIQDLLDDDVPVHGMGFQAHLGIQWGFSGDLQDNLERFDDLGLSTAITEMDVRMILDESGEPTTEQLARQADDYRRALEACLAVDGCRSITIWGFTDVYSWVPHTFEEEGAATVMWDDFTRKPAYGALHRGLVEAMPGGFPDTVGTAHDAHVRVLQRDGVVVGGTDGMFDPAAAVTRAQFSALLARAAGLDTSARASGHPDLAGSTHEGAVAALAEAGIVAGYPDGTFRPTEPIRRDHAAVLVARWLELQPVADGPFTDLHGGAAGLVNAAHDAGVVHGVTATTFAPGETIRRDQSAALISRARTAHDD